MPRHGENDIHPLDKALGSRVRLRRKELGYSQTALAAAVGITFQQIQKYETGSNRISFSRLVEISEALHCSVADLIGDLDRIRASAPACDALQDLTKAGAFDLLKAYASIRSPGQRKAVLNLSRSLAREADESPPKRTRKG